MVKRIMMTLSLICLLKVGETSAMENPNPGPQKQEAKEMTPDQLNAYKMMLMKEHMKNMGAAQSDIHGQIGATLHDISANPVLNGELVYTDKGKETPFKIKELLKEDGSIDLSNKEIFGDAADHLLITTDPEKFFSIDKNGKRLIILITPRFLIKEKIDSIAHFKPIMDKWIVDQAPIGIFYRMEHWENLSWYDYLISANLITISKNSLYKNWLSSERGALARQYNSTAMFLCKNFHAHF